MGDHAEMAALLIEEKQARKKFDEAREAFELWESRLERAESAGRDDLVQLALQELADAKQKGQEAKHAFERLKNEKSMLRVGSRLRDQPETVGQAEALVEDFRSMGINPEDEEIREVVKEQSAIDMLASLKNKMDRGD